LAHDVFISYSQHDKTVADAVCHRMEAARIRCWIAPRDIAHGKTWDDAVVDAITAAKLLVVIFSAAANASRSVLNEVVAALDAGSTVIPFRIEDIRPTGALRLHLGRVHWLDALTPPLDAHIDRLIESAKRYLPAPKEAEEKQHRRQQDKDEHQQAVEAGQAQEEQQRRLQAEKERRRQERVPSPLKEKPGGERDQKVPSRERRAFGRKPTVLASVIAAAVLVLALALGGVFRTPTSQKAAEPVLPTQSPTTRAPSKAAAAAPSQGFMVPKKLGVKSAKELSGATVCMQPGMTELNLADYFRANKMEFKPVVMEKRDEALSAFFSGRCDVFTADSSALNADLSRQPNPNDYIILPERISTH
jgi:hypothetical protein